MDGDETLPCFGFDIVEVWLSVKSCSLNALVLMRRHSSGVSAWYAQVHAVQVCVLFLRALCSATAHHRTSCWLSSEWRLVNNSNLLFATYSSPLLLLLTVIKDGHCFWFQKGGHHIRDQNLHSVVGQRRPPKLVAKRGIKFRPLQLCSNCCCFLLLLLFYWSNPLIQLVQEEVGVEGRGRMEIMSKKEIIK